MYDIHCHILPGVDDGAADIEESIEMVIMARNNGIDTIIATPHYIEYENYNNSKNNISILNALNKELVNKDIDTTIFLGNEVFITPNILNLLNRGEITTLNNSRYLLIELPILSIPIFVEKLIYELRIKGIIPIIAHPERNLNVIENPNKLYNLINKGALVQLNIPSIEGKYGDETKDTAKLLLRHNMVHFIGTDSHSKRSVYRLNHVRSLLSSIITKDKLDEILYENPKKIIMNQNIKIEQPTKFIKRGILTNITNEIHIKIFNK